MVDANPYLATGEARIILNEVNSKNPSHLNGFVEVAGKKAQVIIANPAGVTCEGCGFINSHRATLTTGNVVVENGAVTGYQVSDGKIVVQGAGLDSSRQDKTDLISRAVEVNGDVWANELTVTTGQNQIDADNMTVIQNAVQSEVNRPTVAIDVSDLGGMYAGKIRLVGTEHGVGVKNTGKIGASASNITITADGKLVNTGAIQAKGDVSLTSHSNHIDNSGQLYAEGNIELTSSALTNQGNIESHKNTSVNTRILNNTGDIQNKGTLNVNANIVNNTGTLYAENTVAVAAQEIDNTGLVAAKGDITLSGQSLTNSGEMVANQQLHIKAKQRVDNIGELAAGNNLEIETTYLTSPGKVQSEGNMAVTLGSGYEHTGTMIANGTLNLSSTGTIDNLGTFWAAKQANINALSFNNHLVGEVTAGWANLNLTDTLTNRGLIDGLTTTIQTELLSNIGTGRIYGDIIAFKTHTLQNLSEADKSATLAARELLNIGTTILVNDWHSLIYSGGDLAIGGTLTDDYEVSGAASIVENSSARIESLNDMYINSDYLLNKNAQLIITQEETSRTVHHKAGLWGSPTVYDYNEIKPCNDKYDVTHITVPTGTKSNDWQELYFTRVFVDDVIQETNPGEIIAGGNLVIDAKKIDNLDSHILAGKSLLVDAVELNNFETIGIRRISEKGSGTHWFSNVEHGFLQNRTYQDSNGFSINNYQEVNIDLELTEYKANQAITHTANISESTVNGINTTLPSLTLPTNSLYQINPNGKADYLIETDPRFTDQKKWLGSDYMLKAFNSNHSNQHKRLGDGYYEQKLVKDQIISLTGNRYLGDYTNDEEQYKALMDAGLAAAEKFNLTPGIALSAEQVASLTTDIVWLVTQNVTLPDGTTQEVLVPQVYAKVQPEDLTNAGALLSAKNMQLDLKDDLNNSGRIQTQQTLLVNANNINNNAGKLSGKEIGLTAKQDINNIGGSIVAADTLIAKAGGDINVITTTANNTGITPTNGAERTVINQIGQMGVTGNEGVLVLDAGNDLTLTAANIVNQGEDSQTQLKAGNNLTLNTVQTKNKEQVGDGDNYWRQESTTDVGTQIYAAGDLNIIAGNDIDSIAANVTADKALNVQAGNDLTIREGIATETLDSQTKASNKGLLSSSTTTTRTQIDNQTSIGSQFNGGTISLSAGQDLTVQGSDIIADETLSLKAGKDVNITTAKEQYYTQTTTETKRSGLMSGGGLGVFIGKKSQKNDDSSRDGVEVGSTIGSLNGDVLIQAGNKATIHGSEVIAGGDINALAKSIDITAAANTHDEKHVTETKSSGFTVSLGGSVGSAISSAVSNATQISKNNSDRKNALLGVSSALSGAQAAQDYRLAKAQNNTSSTVGINLSYGTQSTRSEQTLNQVNHTGSNLTAGGDINLVATEQDILVQGSTLDATNNLTLDAKRDILLQAAKDTSKLDGKNESKGGSLGVTYNGGFGVNAGFNKGKGSENGNGVTNIGSELNAGNLITLNSGRDTHIIGSQVKGDGVTLNVGNDLRIESLQDTDNYHSKQTDFSANISVGTGSMGGGISASKTQMDSDYASVQEQAGIFAGTKGVDIEVGNNTHLKGGIIASEGEHNTLSTGTLTFEDIKNKAEFDVSSSGIGINGNLNLGESAQQNGLGGFSTPGATHSNHSGNSESETKATIGGNIDITLKDKDKQTQDIATLNRDTNNAHQSLETIFDKDKEQSRLDEQQLMADIGNQLSNLVRTEGQIRAEKAKSDENALKQAEKELLAEGKEPSKQEIEQRAQNNAQRDWGTGGKYQQVTQALTGALQGALGGDITKALANGSAPYLAEAIKKATTNPDGSINLEANLGAHAILGALLSHANGNNAFAGGLSTLSAKVAAQLVKEQLYGNKPFEDLTEAERQNISALSQIAAGLAGGLAAGSSSDAAQGALVGKNAVENNYLTQMQAEEFISNYEGICFTDACKIRRDELIKKYSEISLEQDVDLVSVCEEKPDSSACTAALKDAIAYNGGINDKIIDARDLLGDRFYSSNNTLNILYNGQDAKALISERVESIDNRADFFGMNDYYFDELGIPIKWYGEAEKVSRACLTGLGATGCGSEYTFELYDWALDADLDAWRAEAGKKIMEGGFNNFSNLYNLSNGNYDNVNLSVLNFDDSGKVNSVKLNLYTLFSNNPDVYSMIWNVDQLISEQKMLQPVHEKYIPNNSNFPPLGELGTYATGNFPDYVEGIHMNPYSDSAEINMLNFIQYMLSTKDEKQPSNNSNTTELAKLVSYLKDMPLNVTILELPTLQSKIQLKLKNFGEHSVNIMDCNSRVQHGLNGMKIDGEYSCD
ncbi:hemagglutinin repeat-containing protein [Thorsellia anophelis]|uniref:Filamentous hemagglutinin n=1 Tax=Thorsellia anophelis DSM 18579 TaxID=1123402 RepID=A0A1I0D6P2_9GAMM|nr:hemagglutinin repeat-containing protein [Thorsellia anophelis]SET27177.1 filamentous hemagglutinin [Thorsellia anophelis DSM 18579]